MIIILSVKSRIKEVQIMSPIRTGISSPLFPVGNLLCFGIFKLSAITVSVEKVGDVARNVILKKII